MVKQRTVELKEDSECNFRNSQYSEFMDEFKNDESIIEPGRTLTDSVIDLVKKLNNHRKEDNVTVTLLKDVFPVWLGLKYSKPIEQVAADRANGLRPNRDDNLTSDDNQNIKYDILLSNVKKDENLVISAQC
ncbi:hypothetical protein FBU30_001684 [Linnemannia zychae]|nr:hypothetical protein FBU30_001684 [Linnemannia zychae]